jgi:hypothetical protein
MNGVRNRVVELVAQPDFLEQPVETFEEPGRAKLEADAYLSMSASLLVDKLVGSGKHRARFLAHFSKHITDAFGAFGTDTNKHIDPEMAFQQFDTSWSVIYRDRDVARGIFAKTKIGKKTTDACHAYVDACNTRAVKINDIVYPDPPPGSFDTYVSPEDLLLAGLGTFQKVAGDTARQACMVMGMTPEQRAARLRASGRGMLKIASLSLNQAVNNISGLMPKHTFEAVDIAGNIDEVRTRPKYATANKEVLRPHHMCPALPNLPEGTILPTGSSIVKLWEMTAGLVVATNLHALDNNEPQYQVTGL